MSSSNQSQSEYSVDKNTALIYKKGKLAATISNTGGVTVFEYWPDYLTDSEATPIATTLPLYLGSITLTNGATPPYFAGLLPEGPRLLAMRERIKTSLNNELALLLDIGSDLIGDVQVLPLGADPETERDAFLIPFRTSDLEFRSIRDRYFGSQASGIPGVQDKISSKMLSARVKTAGNDYILKLNPETIPFAAENENFFLGLANKCGIATARFDLLEDSIGEHALRLKRFDRINKETGKIRLAAEDGCQVMNIYPSEKYDVDFVAMAKALIEICPARGAAGFAIFKQLVFNWLIGNGDAHAKNFSILESESGEWMISPAYDLLCTRFYEDRGDREMALGIRGEKTGWTRKLLLEVANELYVPQKAAEKVIDKQLAELGDLPDQILDGSLPFARHLRNDVHTFLAKRAKSLAAT